MNYSRFRQSEESQEIVPHAPKHWYVKKSVIITLLIVFLPLGLTLMWKFAHWSKKTKWVITGVTVLPIVLCVMGLYNSTPSIIIHNSTSNRINTDQAEYVIAGRVSSTKGVPNLTIGGQPVALTENLEFSHKVSLGEGDNSFELASTNNNGTAKELLIVHRTTKEEFVARAETNRTQAEASQAKRTYDEFYEWITMYMRFSDGSGRTRFAEISSQCDVWKDLDGDGSTDQYYDKSCFQDKYKDYIKPEAFEYGSSTENGGSWICPSDGEYQYSCSKFFDMETHIRAQHSGAYGVDVDREREIARSIYYEISLVKESN